MKWFGENSCSAAWQATSVLVLATAALTSGCSDGRPARVPVAGRVTIDGQPLAAGNIRFHCSDHRAASAKINPDGTFKLSTYEFGDGVVPGSHMVSVNGSKLVNPRTVRWLAPKKYASADTSQLVYDVSGPTDQATIELSWNGGKPFDERIVGADE
jgi:hypothetical protein